MSASTSLRPKIARARRNVSAGFVLMASLISTAHAAQFIVEDGKAPEEISEISRVYIDGKLAATFELNSQTPEKRTVIKVPDDSATHTYALCGEIVIQAASGKHETHLVSSEGALHNPDGHVFQAMGAANFTDFYLIDPESPGAADHQPGRAGACSVPTS
ncbi:hypothetical protein [Acetobacter conturbans]|uniref:Uncharacterized protein n=1 Tax=Acetobacter conturbans TaxID=1737472 RepID=A0ABX0K1H2_9PROT|nr:hypothetical protein [Acetobacter conturbans]NHN88100.1 hypothetical protein [Acetobacter conturbans]